MKKGKVHWMKRMSGPNDGMWMGMSTTQQNQKVIRSVKYNICGSTRQIHPNTQWNMR